MTQDEEARLLNALDPNHEDCRSNHYLRKNTQHADKVQADYDRRKRGPAKGVSAKERKRGQSHFCDKLSSFPFADAFHATLNPA